MPTEIQVIAEQKRAVLRAVESGFSNSPAVAYYTGLAESVAWAHLCALEREGKLERVLPYFWWELSWGNAAHRFLPYGWP